MKIIFNYSWPEPHMTQVHNSNIFDKLYANNKQKNVIISCSVIFSIIILLVMLVIIWYERNGSDDKRSLPKRLYLFAWCTACFWLCTVLPLDIIRYTFGPFSTKTCQSIYFIKTGITAQGIVILDFIMISRYIFIFFLKNPAGVYDEFWSTFIIAWISMFVCISQFIVHSSPTRHFVDFYICTGLDPSTDFSLPERSFLFDYAFKVASFLIHVIIGMRIQIYKRKLSKSNVVHHPRSKSFWLFSMNKYTVITDIWEPIMTSILLSFFVLLNLQKRNSELYKLNEYPYNVNEYFYTLIRPSLGCFLLICIKFLRDKNILKVMMKEFQDQMKNY